MIPAEGAEDLHEFLFVHCLRLPVRFSGPTRSGHYGGMILAESAEDLHGFSFCTLTTSACSLFEVRHAELLWRDDFH